LWDVLESGFGARTEPLLLGISTAGYDRGSLLGDLVREGEEGKDRRFLYRWVGLPQDSEANYRDPATWRLANPALSCRDPFLVQARLVDMARRLPENQFRRLHLNQWTTGRDVAFADDVWEAASVSPARHIPDGTEVIVAFVAARARDTVAIVGCTLDEPHVFPIRIWEESERVDPNDVAEELRAIWSRYNVAEFLCSEHDWSWLLLMLNEEGLPVTRVPRSPQRLALQWSQFFDAVLEKRLSHDGDRVLSRHVSNLGLISGPAGPRPDLDVAEGQPIAAALGAIVAYDGVTRTEPASELRIILPTVG
jgi:phage terminase large subunit-like protein